MCSDRQYRISQARVQNNETSYCLGNPIIDNITNKDVSYDKKQIYSEILEDKKRAEQLLLSAKR